MNETPNTETIAEPQVVEIPALEAPKEPEKKESNAGRPKVITPQILDLLRQAYLMGCTDVEACLFANIGRTTLYEYEKQNPDFRTEKEEWKENPVLLARKTVYENLADDKQTAQWYLERKVKKEFSPRQELTGDEGKPLTISFDPVFNATPPKTERDSTEPSPIQDSQSGS